jgi:DNA-binding MarR family transcriptional regulator
MFPSSPACRLLVAGTINSLPAQSIPRRKRRLTEAEIAGWEAFLRAYAATTRALEREAESRGGLPIGEHFLLVQIARGPATGLRPTELAARALLTKSGITRAVDRLERGGFVERADCPSDGRGSHVVLTAKGRRLLRRSAPGHMRAIARHFADPLTGDELRVLTAALERVATSE